MIVTTSLDNRHKDRLLLNEVDIYVNEVATINETAFKNVLVLFVDT